MPQEWVANPFSWIINVSKMHLSTWKGNGVMPSQGLYRIMPPLDPSMATQTNGLVYGTCLLRGGGRKQDLCVENEILNSQKLKSQQ